MCLLKLELKITFSDAEEEKAEEDEDMRDYFAPEEREEDQQRGSLSAMIQTASGNFPDNEILGLSGPKLPSSTRD